MGVNIEPITEASFLIVADLFSKILQAFKTIVSVFPFVIGIFVVTELNTKLKNSISGAGFRIDFSLWMVKPRLPKRDAVASIF